MVKVSPVFSDMFIMTSSSLARYHARSPRYVLNTADNHLIRFSGAERIPWEEHTEIRDISLTGLAFTASTDLSPQLGEVIKIQFDVPGSQQMACYAVVIRVDAQSDEESLIGVHFYKLDRLQRLNLVQGLAQKVSRRVDHPAEQDFRLSRKIALVGLIFTIFSWIVIMKIFFLR